MGRPARPEPHRADFLHPGAPHAAVPDSRSGQGLQHREPPHAAISNSPDDPIAHAIVREEKGLRPGGLGLVMTRALVDELIYNEARNEVVFIKYLD